MNFKGAYINKIIKEKIDIDSLLKCYKCKDIINNGKWCEICKEKFCNGCWDTKDFAKICFICHSHNIVNLPNSYMNLLKSTKFLCKFYENGCKQILSYDIIEPHEKLCIFIGINCSNKGCNKTVIKKNYEDHKLNCLYTIKKCIHCSIEVKNMDLNNHYSICPKYPINCKGCKEDIFQSQFQKHLNKCNFIEIKCPFCSKFYLRKELLNHQKIDCLVENIDLHTKNCMNTLNTLKKQINYWNILLFKNSKYFEKICYICKKFSCQLDLKQCVQCKFYNCNSCFKFYKNYCKICNDYICNKCVSSNNEANICLVCSTNKDEKTYFSKKELLVKKRFHRVNFENINSFLNNLE